MNNLKHRIYYIIMFAALFSCDKKKANEEIQKLNSIPESIILNQNASNGIFILNEQQLVPNENGIIAEIKLELPEFEKGVYYRPFSSKLASGNRMEPLWFSKVSQLENYKTTKPRFDDFMNLGAFLMFKKPSGNYLALLPVVSNTIGNTFSIHDNSIFLSVATYGTKTEQVSAPLLAYAESNNPYEAACKAWELAKNAEGVKGNVNWRSDKTYPEPFKYLGWCSWEHFKQNINEKNILESINGLKKSDIPFRWALVDDGYLDQENGKLLSFGTDKNKFPNGWKTITNQKDEKIKWMGIWRNMQGYMQGISPNHTMKNLNEHIVSVKYNNGEKFMPKLSPKSANAFYHEMTSVTKQAGFDIIKVDFQSDNYFYNRGSNNAIHGVHLNNTALEENCINQELSLLNCIAQQNFNVFNQRYSAVIRGSIDYKTTKDRLDLTLVQNFANSFWLGHTHWLDQDMFFANYKETAQLMAVARAVSGGPIYLSDEPQNIDSSVLKPLTYADGRILGTLAPGVPLPESLMQDPYYDGSAFRVIAPLENKTAIIMAVNLNQDDKELSSTISIKDYPFAGSMIQPYHGLWDIPKEGILLYNHYAGSASILKDDYQFELGSRKECLFQLSPIQEGWSIIGRPDKYLSASGFKLIEIDEKIIKIKLMEDGPILLWSDGKKPSSDNFEFTKLENGLWRGEFIKSDINKEYMISAL